MVTKTPLSQSTPAALSAEQLTEILENLGDGLVTVDHGLTITYWNKKAGELLNASSADRVGRNFLDVYHSEQALQVHEQLTLALRSAQPVHFDQYLPLTERWFEISAYPSTSGLSIYFRNITERKLREVETRITAERYEFVSQATSDVLWDWNLLTRELFINQSFTRILGYPVKGDLSPHQLWANHLHPDDKDRVVADQLRALRDPSIAYWEAMYSFYRADGSIAVLKDRAIIMRKDNGKAFRMIGAAQDITHQREAEQRLEKRERQFRAMVQSGLDVVILLNENFTIQYISPNAYILSGYSPEELQGLLVLDPIHPDDTNAVFSSGLHVLSSSQQVELPHFRYRFKNGHYAWLEATLTNCLNDESIQAIIVNVRDISAKKAALDEARMLSLVAEQTVNAVIITDPQERITWVNKAFTLITEYSFEEAIGKRPGDLLRGENSSVVTGAYLRRCIAHRQPFNCEILNYSKYGRPYWLEIKGQPLFDEKGALKQFFAIETDITARKEIEEAVRQSEERYRMLFYQSPVPKWIFSYDSFRFIEVNDAAIRHYGYSRQEFLSMSVTDIRPQQELPRFKAILERMGRAKEHRNTLIVKHLTKSGKEIHVEVSTHGLDLSTGFHIMVEVNDVTEKMELQQLVIEEKIAGQKEIAKAIINTQEKERSEIGKELHDNVNQILTTTKLYIENIGYYPAQQEMFVKKSAALVQQAIKEIRDLSKALVTPTIYDIGFKATLDELIEHYKSLQLFTMHFQFEAIEDTIEKGMTLTIYRIVQEQLNNIVKYAAATVVSIQLVQDKDGLHLTIRDNGKGFDVSVKKTGLGLNNIRNRAEVFKGVLTIAAAAGKGCTLSIDFPC